MTRARAEEYRRLAQECLTTARLASTGEARVASLEMARALGFAWRKSKTTKAPTLRDQCRRRLPGNLSRPPNSNNRSSPRARIRKTRPQRACCNGPRLPGFGSLASTNATISSTDHSLSVMPAAAKFKLRHYPRLSLPPRPAHGRPRLGRR
jgi:hypothetical protein